MQSRHTSSAVLVALLVAVGCAPSNPSIDIEGVTSPTDECEFEPGDSFILNPILDTSEASLAFRDIRYRAILQVVNRMLNTANNRYPLMANPNDWQATEAEVEIRGIDGAPLGDLGLPARFRVPAAGIAPAAAGTEPGLGLVTVDVIPAVYGEALLNRTGTIVVSVRLTGTTTGDSTQQTGEWVFPVDLCVGCLFACVIDESTCLPVEGPVCLAGQDRVVNACLDAPPPCTPL